MTQYSGINSLTDVDTTTNAPTNNQVLKWSQSDGKWLPGDDQAGISSLNLFQTINADTGSTTADTQTDTLTITGGTNINTSITGDTVTIDFAGTINTSLTSLTDTDLSGLVQGEVFL